MRISLRLDDQLLAAAKRMVRETGRTLRDLVEDSLREAIVRRGKQPARTGIRLKTHGAGGLRPRVDLDDTSALLGVMEERGHAPT